MQIDYETAKRIIDEACRPGLRRVVITSGECTICRDFLKIAEYIKSKYLQLLLHTNAVLMYGDKNLFDEIINIYPSNIQISLYSMKPDIHDYITGQKDPHKKALYVIEKLNEHNSNVNIQHIENYAKSLIRFSSAFCRFINNPKNNNLFVKFYA